MRRLDPLPYVLRDGRLRGLLRMRPLLTAILYPPHPEERAPARVSKDAGCFSGAVDFYRPAWSTA